ncbi:hypothetical protein PoB_002244400 [Plakobranchus ocellatus]|uniref:Uncharacterized protein n=1 Tax=Plakobranchus ocellatus TaxID=259542 RepID=A0AAV3ZKV4_9GAST|nr:hypothetical protein PoB_002244400 [Plakobranchus ocellatus]
MLMIRLMASYEPDGLLQQREMELLFSCTYKLGKASRAGLLEEGAQDASIACIFFSGRKVGLQVGHSCLVSELIHLFGVGVWWASDWSSLAGQAHLTSGFIMRGGKTWPLVDSHAITYHWFADFDVALEERAVPNLPRLAVGESPPSPLYVEDALDGEAHFFSCFSTSTSGTIYSSPCGARGRIGSTVVAAGLLPVILNVICARPSGWVHESLFAHHYKMLVECRCCCTMGGASYLMMKGKEVAVAMSGMCSGNPDLWQPNTTEYPPLLHHAPNVVFPLRNKRFVQLNYLSRTTNYKVV